MGREQEIDLTSSMSGPDCPWASLDSMIRFSPQPHLSHIRLSSQCITYIALFKNFYLFLFLVAVGLCCGAQAFSGRREQGLLSVVFRLLTALASSQSTGCRHKGFVSCGTHVLVVHGPVAPGV